MAQARFWKEFHQFKVQTVFVQKLLLEAERNEQFLKIFTAITSSVSIGAWVIWRDLAWVWGTLIATSQVISAIHPHLPYKDRLKTYADVLREFEKLLIDVEHKWHSVADGSMSSRQIDKERSNLQKKIAEILNKNMPKKIFPVRPKITAMAEAEATLYFSRFYPKQEEVTNELLELEIKMLEGVIDE